MLRPTENGLPWAANGNEPSLLPVHSAGEQLVCEISTRERLFWPTQLAAATPLTRPAYSHQPLPGTPAPKIPASASVFLHVVTKSVNPTALYLLDWSPSIIPLIETTAAIRLWTPQFWVPTPPGPVFDATSKATRAPVLWPIRMIFRAVGGNSRWISWTSRKRHS